MSMSGDEAYVLAMDYVDETLEGGGALKGDDGKSAYQSWLDLGNTGTEEDFINSLKGEKGQVGEKGDTGNNGKSSYEIWLDNGNVGTEQDFLDSLKGDGADGFSPVITENSNNTDEDYRLDIETKESKFTTPNLKADISKNIAEHNTSPDSHNDIRIFLNELNNRLNALANSDDETLDEMKEVVAYIKDNRSLIESITTTKVNVADIIDNLTTNVSNRPLSASQGVVIKNLIDTLQSELTTHINNADIHVTANDKTNWNNATDKINNLEVGGRNLLLNTANEIICDGKQSQSNYFSITIYENLEKGETYTFSAELTIEGSDDKRATISMYNGLADSIPTRVCQFIGDGERHSVTFTVLDNYPYLILYAGVAGATYGVTATYHHAKLEKGNVATDWSPAPEDKIEISDVNGLQTIVDTTERKYHQTIDLSDTSVYDENTWYPCIGTPIPYGMRRIQLESNLTLGNKPSWGTHGNDNNFTCTMDLLVIAHGWGATDGHSICLNYNYDFTEVAPCGYLQMITNSAPVFMLRGGAKYNAYADYNCVWTPITTEYSYGGKSVKPTTDFSIICVNIAKSTIHANLKGNADGSKALVDSSGTPLQIGESTKPVYFVDGKPKVCDLTIDAIQGLRAELDELRSLITNS